MSSKSERLGIVPAAAGEAGQYATAQEVEKALLELKDEEHTKLMLIARSFCKSRRLATSVMEPQELLAEAFAKTLRLDKKWNKRISIVRHLDRAMENISGHLVRERKKIDSFPQGFEPSAEQRGPIQTIDGADEALMRTEEVQQLLSEVFGDDTEAASIFDLRLQGFQAAEIQAQFGLSATGYDSVARRIRRKIALHLNKTK